MNITYQITIGDITRKLKATTELSPTDAVKAVHKGVYVAFGSVAKSTILRITK